MTHKLHRDVFRRAALAAASMLLLAMFGIVGCAHVPAPEGVPSTRQAAATYTASDPATRPYDEVGKWTDAIAAFQASDRITPPAPGGIVFVGSSSIVFWDTLTEDMSPLPVVQRGFGGSKIYDAVYYADRIVWPYQPKAIVMFSGSNDLVQPMPGAPAKVEQGVIDFIADTRARFPGIDIHYISVSPSRARWAAYAQVRETNQRIAALAEQDPSLYFIDTASALMRDGAPKSELFREDGLHLNSDGYAVWTSIIRPHLKTLYGDAGE